MILISRISHKTMKLLSPSWNPLTPIILHTPLPHGSVIIQHLHTNSRSPPPAIAWIPMHLELSSCKHIQPEFFLTI